MKKIVSILLTIAMVACMVCFAMPASAVTTQVVTIDAPAEVIEVDPGQENVEVTWTVSQNEGWGAFKFYVEFNGDVFSYVANENGEVEEDVTYSIAIDSTKNYKKISGLTTAIYGLDQVADTSLNKNRSAFLIEGKDNSEDVTFTGALITFYLNIAEDAAAGEYEIKVTTDPNNSSSMKGQDYKPEITWGTAKVKVKGGVEPQPDPRLNVAGAQIRVPVSGSETPKQGLRFISTITPELYQTLVDADALPKSASDTGVGFGTVVIPTANLTGSLTKETEGAYIVPAVKLYEAPTDTEVTYTACMTDIADSRLNVSFTVVPYVTYMNGETEVTVYGAQYAVSVFEVAESIWENTAETQYNREYVYQEILYVVDPETYNEPESWSGIYKP